MQKLKKVDELSAVNEAVFEQIDLQQVNVDIVPVKLVADIFLSEEELDEMWSFVQKKENQRWICYAIDHEAEKILAYVLGITTARCLSSLKHC